MKIFAKSVFPKSSARRVDAQRKRSMNGRFTQIRITMHVT